MKRRWYLSSLVVLSLLMGGVAARAADDEEEKKKEETTTPAVELTVDESLPVDEQIESIVKQMNDLQTKLLEKFKSTTDSDERQKIQDEFLAFREKGSAKIAEIAEAKAEEPGALNGLVFVYLTQRKESALEAIKKHHVKNEKIGPYCVLFAKFGMNDFSDFISEVAEKNKGKEASALAKASKALLDKTMTDRNQLASEDEKKKVESELESTVELAVKDFPDVKIAFMGQEMGTVKTLLGGTLFELRHLSIGKEIADLAGPDMDGEEFKLSDYRGKVVLVDFWAFW